MSSHELVPTDPFQVPDDPDKVSPGPKAHMAFELRKTGASYELIAEKLGYASAQSAQAAINSRLKRMYEPDDVKHVMEMELARLDALQLVAWRLAQEGNLSAMDRILKIMERRAKLLGLDQPEPVADTSTYNTAIFIGGTEQEYVAQLQQAREQAMTLIQGGKGDG